MTEIVELASRGILLGVAGAAAMDAWALVARRAFGLRGLDYALLGRWIGHMPRGTFVHAGIASAAPIPGERPLGWLAHYAIGVAFALVLLGIWGLDWARSPSILPPFLVAFATILAPWLVMQPAMGAGLAGARTPDPDATRRRNLASHAAYGSGLYLSALVLSAVWS